MAEILLELENISKRFTGTLALDSVSFDVQAGEVHALLGENGAGKSTLIKILAGVYRADQGTIRVKGRTVDPATGALPISFIHQDLGLVDTMTVAENVAVLAGYPRRNCLIDWSATREQAVAALDRMGGGIDPDMRVGDLPAAEKSIVAIGRAMSVPCDVLVLDEPTAALPENDVARLLEALNRLRADGLGIVYVTHRLDEIFRIADRVTVLRDGRRVATDAVARTTPAALVHNIVGRSLADVFAKPVETMGKVALSVRSLQAAHVGPVSFTVAAGEVTGLVGLRGAGHEVVGRALFGDMSVTTGEVELDGRRIAPRRPLDAIRCGIGFISSKRGEENLARTLSVCENLFLNPKMTGVGVLSPITSSKERSRCLHLMRRFSIKPAEPERVIASLSGGNQQKVIVARWMEAGSKLLVLEEPTIGVDVGSKAEIYHLLQEALKSGLAVLLISSDFEEVAGICHKALIFDRGRVSAELTGPDITIARLIAQASGGQEQKIQARLT